MKLLLTSNGITNDTLASELVDLAGTSFDQMKIAFIPTAGLWDDGDKDWLIKDMYRLHKRGAAVDIVDIAQLPGEVIRERLEWADVIFVGGGNTYYLSYWMEQCGMFEWLPDLLNARVYAGISAGSMIASCTLRISSTAYKSEHFADETYQDFGPAGRSSARTFNWVDFAFRPHLNSRYFPEVTERKMQTVADIVGVEMYVVDDRTAVRVVDDDISVVGEGESYVLQPINAESRE